MKIKLVWFLSFFLIIAATAYAQQPNPQVQMITTKGTIMIELNTQAAPKTVANFLAYVRSGFYDNTVFHRVIKGFMIQGGGFTADMRQKPTQPAIANEADNGLKNALGTIAMARTNVPHSATAQFFINVADNTFLNHTAKTTRGWGYCVFGKVVQGMEVVKAVEMVKTTMRAGHRDVPADPVVITHATVVEPEKPKS